MNYEEGEELDAMKRLVLEVIKNKEVGNIQNQLQTMFKKAVKEDDN